MEPLFKDSEVYTKVRPTKITEQQKQDFYKKIAEEIIKGGWSTDEPEDIISDVSDISFHDSGYEIAKDLEGYGKKASYDIDTLFIEYLDDLGYDFSKILDKNIEEWVSVHNPKPKYDIGQKLILEKTIYRDMQQGITLYVNGLDTKRACYLIDEDKEKKGGRVIPYEEIETSCTPA